MKDNLQNKIELLREELAKIDDAESFAEHFQALNTAIDKLQEDADLEQRREANDQLDEIVTNFEIDHPVIHGLLRNVMKTLADIGI